MNRSLIALVVVLATAGFALTQVPNTPKTARTGIGTKGQGTGSNPQRILKKIDKKVEFGHVQFLRTNKHRILHRR